MEADSALSQAKKRAQEILDLSASDIDDLLNSDQEDSDSDAEEKVDIILLCHQTILWSLSGYCVRQWIQERDKYHLLRKNTITMTNSGGHMLVVDCSSLKPGDSLVQTTTDN